MQKQRRQREKTLSARQGERTSGKKHLPSKGKVMSLNPRHIVNASCTPLCKVTVKINQRHSYLAPPSKNNTKLSTRTIVMRDIN